MKSLVLVVMVTVLAASSPAGNEVENAAEAIEHYRSGMAAIEKKDWPAYERGMRAAVEAAPGQPVLMRHLARALALQGKDDEAVQWLERVAATGMDLGISSDEHFASLRGRDDFQSVVANIAAARTPLGNAEVAIQLDLDDFLPEGIAYDPDDDVFYIGSIRRGRIIRVSTTGQWEEFAAPDDMHGVLGLRIDSTRRQLWAASAVMAGVVGFSAERNGNSALHCFDLDGGGVVAARFHLSNADGEHNLNDLVVGPHGAVYITDSVQGTIYTVEPGGDELLEFIPAGELRGPNGIAIAPDGKLLYVAQYAWGVVTVDLEARSWQPMRHPDDVYPIGIDGLYLDGDALVGIQNYAGSEGLEHVTRFGLSDDGRAIVNSRILARHHPRFDDPTTAAIRGDDIYVIANSQLTRIDADGNVPPPATFDDTFIVRVPVK